MKNSLRIGQSLSSTQTIVFHFLRVIIILGMLGGGITQVLGIDYQIDQFTRLGYPLYLMSIIGTAKILAALVLILHRWPLLTVGAYVGIFIVCLCAFLSHLVSDDGVVVNPLILLGITISCCMLDPTIRFLKD